MKNVLSALGSTNDMYVTADTENLAGGKAWTMSNEDRVMQVAMTGTLGNSYYASTKDLVDDAVDTFVNADPQVLHDAIIRGRNDGFIRTGNILGLIWLSKKSTPLFRDAFCQVIKTGNDMADFISMTKKIRGFGSGIQKAMHSWIEKNTTEFYALKYRTQIADAIRLSRFKGEDPIYKFVLGHYGDKVKGWKEADLKKAFKKYPKLAAYQDASEFIANGESQKAMSLIEEHRLDIASLFGVGKIDDKVWQSFVKVMPTMMMLKYLNKLDATGVANTEEGFQSIVAGLTVEKLQKAKVFPFRLYIAYMNVTNMRVRNLLADVLDQYTKIYDWNIFNSAGSWAICPDVSGSMQSRVNGSDLAPSVIAGLFSGFLYKGLNDAEIFPWGDHVKEYNRPKADSVITHIQTIANATGGGTRMEVALQHMMQKKMKKDNVVFITDSMEYGSGWLTEWKLYKKLNPRAKAFLIRVDGYNTSPISDDIAKQLDVYQIFGWSDNTIKFMQFMLETSNSNIKKNKNS